MNESLANDCRGGDEQMGLDGYGITGSAIFPVLPSTF